MRVTMEERGGRERPGGFSKKEGRARTVSQGFSHGGVTIKD